MPAEAQRASTSDQCGIGAAQAFGNGPRGLGDECGVELRRFAGDVFDLRAREQHRLARHDHAGRGAVIAVVEQQSFAHGPPGPRVTRRVERPSAAFSIATAPLTRIAKRCQVRLR